jgi:ribosomal protein L7Ae-like RNA K-turn-binding protein
VTAVQGEGKGGRPPRNASARAVFDLLGLSARAGALVIGINAARAAVREGGIRRVILAADAAEGQRNKLVPLLDARRIPYDIAFTREELGAAAGRAPASAVGLTNAQLAQRLGEVMAALPLDDFQGGR